MLPIKSSSMPKLPFSFQTSNSKDESSAVPCSSSRHRSAPPPLLPVVAVALPPPVAPDNAGSSCSAPSHTGSTPPFSTVTERALTRLLGMSVATT